MPLARFASVFAVAAALLLTATAGPAHGGQSKALKCAFAKQRIAVKTTGALLACEREALTAQTPVDPACTAAAMARFQAAFLKVEMNGGCQPAGDAVAVAEVVDRCAQQIVLGLQGSCSASGALCGGGAPPCCTGLVCQGAIGQPPTCRP